MQAIEPFAALLDQPLRLVSASDLHSRITLLEDAVRACRTELQRRPTHCREPTPSQSAASSSSCVLLELSHDELNVVAHALCEPLLLANLGITANGLRVPMQAKLAQLKQQHQAQLNLAQLKEAEALAALTEMNLNTSTWSRLIALPPHTEIGVVGLRQQIAALGKGFFKSTAQISEDARIRCAAYHIHA